MHPVLFHFGPVTLVGLLLLTVFFGVSYLILAKVFKINSATKGNVLFIFAILWLGTFILAVFHLTFPLRTYSLMIAFGFISATLLSLHHAKDVGMTPDHIMDLAVITLIAGIIGTRVFYVIFFWDWKAYQANPNPLDFFAIWNGGMVLYGGVIFGILAVLFYLKKRKINILSAMDLLMLSLLPGIGFGRIGCLGSGCCYGKVTTHWGLSYPKFGEGGNYTDAFRDHLSQGLITSDSLRSLPTIPAPLIESCIVFILFFILYYVFRKRRAFNGQIMALVIILYAVERFIIEYFRVNPFMGPFTAAQWTSLGLFAVGLIMLTVLSSKNRAAKNLISNK